jgi:photosystem II stability/assembly factor-like uncharacterized protein
VLYAATSSGIATIDGGDGSWTAELALRASAETTEHNCLALDPRRPGTIFGGLWANGLWRSEDGGATWSRLDFPGASVSAVTVSPVDGAVYAGTEPSALYRSDDGGDSWQELPGLLELPSRPRWSFPPRPWTSHVRSIAASPHEAGTLILGIELGGLMRSTDRGETWQDHRPGAQPDVHSLVWHPTEHGRAYEAGGGGAAWSDDDGETWRPADEGRDRHYTWSVAADPQDAACWYVSASTGPRAAHRGHDPEARVYRFEAGRWQALGGGLPEPLPAMPYALCADDGRLYCGFADGALWQSSDRGDSWQPCRLAGEPLGRLDALAAA